MNKQAIVNQAKIYLLSLAELMQEDIEQARQEWFDAGCPSDNVWSIDLTVDSIVAANKKGEPKFPEDQLILCCNV